MNFICRDSITRKKPVNCFVGSILVLSQDSVFPLPTSDLASWPPPCPETPHFNGFLAPEYASQPTVIHCKALSLDKVVALVGFILEKFFACRRCRRI